MLDDIFHKHIQDVIIVDRFIMCLSMNLLSLAFEECQNAVVPCIK